jgi:ketosteroid isomerase-like protein
MQNYLKSLDGKIPPHNYTLEDFKVQVYDNIAIATLRYNSSKDGESGIPWKATDVYRFTNGDWKLVHAHWSLVKEM